MDITIRKRPEATFFFCYLLLLFISAFTRDFGLTPLVARSLGSFAAALVEPLWKGIFWIGPIVLYIKCVKSSDVLTYLKLNRNITRGIVWGLLGSSLFLLQFVVYALRGMPLHLAHSLDGWLNGVILVGLIEETVFRGFLFQEIQGLLEMARPPADPEPDLQEPVDDGGGDGEVGIDLSRWIPTRYTFWASTLSTLLFVAIHYPVWIELHAPLWLMLSTSLFNLLFGYALCAVFRLSGSLWSAILMHSINDGVLLLFT